MARVYVSKVVANEMFLCIILHYGGCSAIMFHCVRIMPVDKLVASHRYYSIHDTRIVSMVAFVIVTWRRVTAAVSDLTAVLALLDLLAALVFSGQSCYAYCTASV